MRPHVIIMSLSAFLEVGCIGPMRKTNMVCWISGNKSFQNCHHEAILQSWHRQFFSDHVIIKKVKIIYYKKVPFWHDEFMFNSKWYTILAVYKFSVRLKMQT